MLPCLYCESVTGDLPQAVVYEDGDVVAFLDWRQSAPGHVLIVPRRHLAAEELFADPAGPKVMAAVMRVADAVRAALGLDGVQMGAILYPGAGEAGVSGRLHPVREVPLQTAEDGHFHLHVLPRTYDGEVARIYPFGDEVGRPDTMKDIAAGIRTALADAGYATGEASGRARA